MTNVSDELELRDTMGARGGMGRNTERERYTERE